MAADNPILHARAETVRDIATEVTPFVGAMRVYLIHCHGVGLAAPQVGISKCFFLFRETPDGFIKLAINPGYLRIGADQRSSPEGCLTYPGRSIHVVRWQAIQAHWLDQQGKIQHTTLTGFAARIFQHEYDHLNGITIFL